MWKNFLQSFSQHQTTKRNARYLETQTWTLRKGSCNSHFSSRDLCNTNEYSTQSIVQTHNLFLLVKKCFRHFMFYCSCWCDEQLTLFMFSPSSLLFFFRCDNKGIVNKFFVVNWEQVNQTSVDFLPILLLAIADKMTFELFFLTWIPNNVRIFLGMQSFNKIKNKNGGVKIQLRFEGIKL